MKRIRFGRTGVESSAVCVGTWGLGGANIVGGRPVGWFGTDDREARQTLLESYAAGVTHWDTADVYGAGKAERLIGSCWQDVPRDEIFLATKVGWDPGSHSHYYHPEQIRRQLESSLRNLRTECIDLYYLQHCDFGPHGEYLDEAVDLLHTFRAAGRIRFIGLSDWKNEAIAKFANRVNPDVIQCYRNVVDDAYESSGLKHWVDTHDAGIAFFSPLKHALLLGLFEGPVTFGGGDHRSVLTEFRDFGLISRLRACRREMEKRFSEHPEPVLYGLVGALLADAPAGCVVVGQRRPDHVTAAAQVGEPLSESDARWVRQLYQENGRVTRASWKSFQQAR